MNSGKTIFAQLMDFAPAYEFRKCVNRYSGNRKVISFSCWDQYLCMAFSQLTFRESLRDIEAYLRATQSRLYHLGIRGKISRNTLANANQTRDWRIYADFAQILIAKARTLYAADSFGIELEQAVYVMDSTTIDLCLALFPWAEFRKRKGAVKLHTLLDLHGNIPSVVIVTTGKVHDVNILDQLILEAGAFYILDRGYTDFSRLYMFTQHSAFFIIRAKSNLDHSRRNYRLVDKTTGLRSDQTILLKGPKTSQDYPDPLRRIGYFDSENRKRLVFLTNNFSLPPLTIARLYKCRWQVELFFKWIKQHLRIKSFYGTSVNAVKTQIWIAISVYVLVAIVKKELILDRSLNDILQILSITIFEKSPIYQVFSGLCSDLEKEAICKQLSLFNN